MPKFFVKTNQINQNKIQIIGEDVKHITQVLRAKIGEELILCNIETNQNYLSKIQQITSEFIICDIIKTLQSEAEMGVEVTIFQGLPKADKMEYIIQKNTELGVKQIIPLILTRCVAKLDKKDEAKKIERWQKIALSAAKQSGRDYVPQIQAPITISKLCEKLSEFDLSLLAYENEQTNTLKNELTKIKNKKTLKIAAIIGPEGGIDSKEVQMLEQAGAKIITLGKRILRTETASTMIMSNIIYEYEM